LLESRRIPAAVLGLMRRGDRYVRLAFLLALWSLSAVAVGADAAAFAEEGPSFDCGKADTNTARLVCEDTFLMALDLRLAKAYDQQLAKEKGQNRAGLVAQQRAWLTGNETACQAPDHGKAGFSETVEPRLCLSQRYLDRLTAFGAAPAAPATTNNPGIHPRCVQLLGEVLADGQSKAALPFTQCDRVYRSVSVRRSDGSWLEAAGATPFVPSFRYKPFAALSDGGEAVVAVWGVNGAGYTASAILKLYIEGTGQSRILSAQVLVQGGSNCQRGILDARSVPDRTFDVVFAVTPYDLVVSISPSLRTREGLDLLTGRSGPTKDACVGSLVERYAPPYTGGTIEHGTLEQATAMAGSPIDDCFVHIFSARDGGPQKTVLDRAELQSKTDAFARACLSPVR
jgi:uncharacterized protein YecT (DUF1311 family)